MEPSPADPDAAPSEGPDVSIADVTIVGAGAAGLMAAIQARRAAPGAHVRLVDGQAKLGAKILISGGGRCNVTHEVVDETDFAGATPPAIRKVLRAFPVDAVVRFFEAEGVALKREETGKLFPVSNRARTVLDALLAAVDEAGVERRHPFRVAELETDAAGFVLRGPHGSLRSRRVVLATGGRSVVQTGSDGHGYVLARSLGHTVTRTWPALVPLTLPDAHPLTTLRGISAPARLTLERASGKRLHAMEGPVLFTHFGLSGPAAMDISRYLLDARRSDPEVRLVASWRPVYSEDQVDRWMQRIRGPVHAALAPDLTTRFAETLLALAGVPPQITGEGLRRTHRAALRQALCRMPLPVVDHRGWRFAEVTAGGVPLREVRLDTLASRVCPGLHLCGEILDVDGRIGGFNFQWAWASGALAGQGAVRNLDPAPSD